MMNTHHNDDRAILVNIQEETYPISKEVLYQVFSPFGHLDDIIIFGFGCKFHSKINFQSRESSTQAMKSLQDRYIYDGCCQLKLVFESEVTCVNATNSEMKYENKSLSLFRDKVLSAAYKVFDEMSHPIHPKSEFTQASKKIRYYITITNDKIYELWENDLCELCEEPFFLGHKCKKISPNHTILLVNEEEEKHYVNYSLDEWLKKEKDIAKYNIHPSHSLDSLDAFTSEVGSIEKSISATIDNIHQNVQLCEDNLKITSHIHQAELPLEDDGNVLAYAMIANAILSDHVKKSAPHTEFSAISTWAGHGSPSTQQEKLSWELGDVKDFLLLDPIKISKEHVEYDFSKKLDKWSLYGFNPCLFDLSSLFTRNHTGQWDGYSCFISFDPGKLQSNFYWLPIDIHTIHKLEAISVVFDRGKNKLKLSMHKDARLVFDPGGLIVALVWIRVKVDKASVSQFTTSEKLFVFKPQSFRDI